MNGYLKKLRDRWKDKVFRFAVRKALRIIRTGKGRSRQLAIQRRHRPQAVPSLYPAPASSRNLKKAYPISALYIDARHGRRTRLQPDHRDQRFANGRLSVGRVFRGIALAQRIVFKSDLIIFEFNKRLTKKKSF